MIGNNQNQKRVTNHRVDCWLTRLVRSVIMYWRRSSFVTAGAFLLRWNCVLSWDLDGVRLISLIEPVATAVGTHSSNQKQDIRSYYTAVVTLCARGWWWAASLCFRVVGDDGFFFPFSFSRTAIRNGGSPVPNLGAVKTGNSRPLEINGGQESICVL